MALPHIGGRPEVEDRAGTGIMGRRSVTPPASLVTDKDDSARAQLKSIDQPNSPRALVFLHAARSLASRMHLP
ncbi:MAG: hypothetical protein WBP94_14725 [Rhodomicrobiaceae bacterium]